MTVAEHLEVRLRDTIVGSLQRTRTGARFQYAPEIVESLPGSPLLSTSLRVQSDPFSPEETSSWFAGLLPEDRQRDEVLRRFALQSGTYFDLLREIGWECAGAVTLGRAPGGGSLRPLAPEELAQRLAALPSHPYDDTDALRVTLGGFQSKLLVTLTDGHWALPLDGAISTHILKPQPGDRYPGMVEAEAWAMRVAAEVTATAETALLAIDGGPSTLVVTRFDRARTVDGLRRIHQEDGAQAIGVPPERKYASSGSVSRSDPTLAAIARVLSTYAVDPIAELSSLARQLTVNVALGNTDAHAKNYGILHGSVGTVTLSPLYDVVPATFVNPSQLEMGLRVDGILRIDRVTNDRLQAEIHSWGLPAEVVATIVGTAFESLHAGIAQATELYPTATALRDHVLRRLDSLS